MPDARYRDLMPRWGARILAAGGTVLKIVFVWRLSGVCLAFVAGMFPEPVHCGMPAAMGRYRDFRMDIRCR